MKSTLFLFSLSLLIWLAGCDDKQDDPVIETGTVTDIEGHVYKTVKIGTQWWMAENLAVTYFNDGTPLEKIEGQTAWSETTQPAYSLYRNQSGPGLLYNFYAANSPRRIAPVGWHVATDKDWKELEEYVGLPPALLDQLNWRGEFAGDKLKEETSTNSGWVAWPGVWGTDEVGFNAIGGSCRVFNGEWGVPGLRHSGYWWTSTSSNGYGWFRYLDYKKTGIFRYNAEPNYGFSIRCVKD
jgi:uncharacterized protein (TIGR02145 family)